MNKNYNYKPFLLLFCVMYISTNLWAQQEDSAEDPCVQNMTKTIEKTFKKARDLHNSGKKEEACQIYADILADNPHLLEVNYYYAMSYYYPIADSKFAIKNKNNAMQALDAFNRIYLICPYYKMRAMICAARLAYFMELFDEATKFAKVLTENPDLVKNMEEIDEAQIIIEKSMFFGEVLKNPVPFEPKPVAGISTKDDEYLATVSPDGEEFYFTRRQLVKTASSYFGGDNSEDREFFCVSKKDENGRFGVGMPLPEPFNKGVTHEGSPTINLTNDLLIFSRMVPTTGNKTSSYPNYDLYMSHWIDGEWTAPENLGAAINRSDSWESQPSLSADGKMLFFASDRPGGYGGSDIWVSKRNDDGSWQKAVNLGPNINTANNERSPFLHADSKTLYFSSAGHDGLGGLDIFYSKYDEKKGWGKAVNMGYPINSENDEVDFFVSLNGKNAYFSSNNIDSKDWNIYQFELYEKARPNNMILIKGEVKSDDNDLVGAIVEIRDTTQKVLATAKVNENTGKYAVTTEIDKNSKQDIIVNVKKAGYSFDVQLIDKERFENGVVTKYAEVKKIEAGKTYDLHDIYFATNSYELNQKSIYTINMLIEFLEENPSIKIEIQGHTDNAGNADANLILSDNRAKSVYDYMLKRGLPANRLRYKGYGQSDPVASNNTLEGRAKNRRTVFLIYEK